MDALDLLRSVYCPHPPSRTTKNAATAIDTQQGTRSYIRIYVDGKCGFTVNLAHSTEATFKYR